MEPPLGGLSFLVKDLIAHSAGDPSTRVVGVWLTTAGSCLQRGEQSSVIIGHGANQGRHRRAGGENFGGASTPFISGVGRSKITASGSGLWAASRASRPFDAAATTCRPHGGDQSGERPSRDPGRSSTTKTQIGRVA